MSYSGFWQTTPGCERVARAAILDPLNTRWVSPISLLQIALKNRIGKLPVPEPFGQMFAASLTVADIHLLPIEPPHIELLIELTFHYKDAFDRLIGAMSVFVRL